MGNDQNDDPAWIILRALDGQWPEWWPCMDHSQGHKMGNDQNDDPAWVIPKATRWAMTRMMTSQGHKMGSDQNDDPAWVIPKATRWAMTRMMTLHGSFPRPQDGQWPEWWPCMGHSQGHKMGNDQNDDPAWVIVRSSCTSVYYQYMYIFLYAALFFVNKSNLVFWKWSTGGRVTGMSQK